MSTLSQSTDINRGTLSGILNSEIPKLPSILQLDKITAALNFKEGYFYNDYIKAYCESNIPHWKKLKPIFIQLISLEREDLIRQLLNWLTEDYDQINSIFYFVEDLYRNKEFLLLLPFYECIIENDRNQQSERYETSQFRVFCLSLNDNDFNNNLRAAIQIEPYLSRMQVGYQLDAFLKLSNIYYVHQSWDKVIEYADRLKEVSHRVYNERLYMKNGQYYLETERHLVVYYGQSYLMKCGALSWQGHNEEALLEIPYYHDLSWFEGLDKIGKHEVEKLKIFAEGNFLCISIKAGNFADLNQYIDFLDKNPKEIMAGLSSLVEAAIKYEQDIDHVLLKFKTILDNPLDGLEDSYYKRTSTIHQYEFTYRQIAIYYLKKGFYMLGLEYLSKCIDLLNHINKNSELKEYPELVNILRDWSSIMSKKESH